MGRLSHLDQIFESHRIALDANIFILAIEANQDFPIAAAFFERLKSKSRTVVTSVLTLLEATVPLFRLKASVAQITEYVDFVNGYGKIQIIPVDGEVAVKAAQYRAEYRLEAPDAIHLATALSTGANIFVTADRDFKMKSVDGVKIITI